MEVTDRESKLVIVSRSRPSTSGFSSTSISILHLPYHHPLPPPDLESLVHSRFPESQRSRSATLAGSTLATSKYAPLRSLNSQRRLVCSGHNLDTKRKERTTATTFSGQRPRQSSRQSARQMVSCTMACFEIPFSTSTIGDSFTR